MLITPTTEKVPCPLSKSAAKLWHDLLDALSSNLSSCANATRNEAFLFQVVFATAKTEPFMQSVVYSVYSFGLSTESPITTHFDLTNSLEKSSIKNVFRACPQLQPNESKPILSIGCLPRFPWRCVLDKYKIEITLIHTQFDIRTAFTNE